MTTLSLDYETASRVDLFGAGLNVYVRDPSTRALMAAYAIDDGPVQLWQPHIQKKAPVELRDAMRDPSVERWAWNAPFEIAVTEHTLGLKTTNWRDTMVQALYASLPGALAQAGPALGLPVEMCKMPEGKRLIRKFSVPRKPTKDKPHEFNDWTTDPEDWELFCDYCKRDVEVEREIRRRLAKIPVPPSEWALWELDQEINLRGIPVDLQLVQNAIEITATEKHRLKRELTRLTELRSLTAAHFLPWAQARGYPFGDLRKATIERSLREVKDMDETLVSCLHMRSQANMTSLAKYDSIKEKTHEGRLYNTLQFYGASRTGRWGGRDPQPQNFPRSIKAVEEKEAHVTEMVRNGEYDEIVMEFGAALPVLSSVVRSSFRASEGKTFYIADLSAIENRVLGWIAGCDAILNVFLDGLDPYKAFGVRMFHKDYADITKAERTLSKPAVLGCGYMLSGGELETNKNGDVIKTGLWGYAEAMGIEMERSQAHESVRVFRAAYPEVVQFWYALRDAAMECVRDQTTIRVGPVVFNGSTGLMRVRLPNGRCLHYVRPKIERMWRKFKKMQPDGTVVEEKKMVDVLTYEGVDQKTKQWGRVTTHPGKITENLVQAIARDVLCEGLKNAKAKGFDIILHCHDEIVCEVPLDSALTLDDLIECMTRPASWAKGLPLAAAGEVTPFYKK